MRIIAGQDKQILVANGDLKPKSATQRSLNNNNNNNNNHCDNDDDDDYQQPMQEKSRLGPRRQVSEGRAAKGELDREDKQQQAAATEFKAEWVWLNIFLFVVLHSSIPAAIYVLTNQRPAPWRTLAWSLLGIYVSGLGVTGGSHRLWSHRSYKARLPVEILLMLWQTMAGQNSIYTWSRDHRVHHKYAETDADPHNIKRGFFFAHMGWLMCRKHPEVKSKGKLIDLSDLEANQVVMFQHRHFWWLSVVCNVLVPTMVPVWFWGERFWTSFVFSFMIRYLVTLHGTWLVNSAAHYHGPRPYDERIEARESPVVIGLLLGEGFHNYHHTFPFDYSTSEFGKYMNITTGFIDLCAALGLAHSLRKVDKDTILQRQLRTGDPSGGLKQRFLQDQQQQRAQDNNVKSDDALVTTSGDMKKRLAEQLAKLDELEDSSKLVHEMPYISGLTSMKYTM